ncbi:hypothetical protein L1987_22719 [Smallanthus sonchifolius]|uniref:Uncharacterized protein n=1 Tax=Smallanthus sonchifolius TaxID=185202 RepID=A0ACB9IFL8_9ASTR|nr:hypothetical protein L1987_22719 [Smallanthus sonchifolius]
MYEAQSKEMFIQGNERQVLESNGNKRWDTPKPRETSTNAVSAVLMTRKEVQTMTYFVSRTLNDLETRYPDIENLALALVYASWHLRRYFETYPIKVLTDQPIQRVLKKPEYSERLATWEIELGGHQITYCPWTN